MHDTSQSHKKTFFFDFFWWKDLTIPLRILPWSQSNLSFEMNKIQVQWFLLKSNTETITWLCSIKKVFLNILYNSQENTCARASFLIMLQASSIFRVHLWWLFTAIFEPLKIWMKHAGLEQIYYCFLFQRFDSSWLFISVYHESTIISYTIYMLWSMEIYVLAFWGIRENSFLKNRLFSWNPVRTLFGETSTNQGQLHFWNREFYALLFWVIRKANCW